MGSRGACFRAQHGAAIIVTLSVLFTLSVLAVSFSRIASVERTASQRYVHYVMARFAAQAGLERATSELRSTFDEYVQRVGPNESWTYYRADPDAGPSFSDDGVATGVSPQDLQADPAASPSYAEPGLLHGLRVSGQPAADQAYTLKILDTSSQLNLNTRLGDPADPANPGLARVLDNLSAAIALREPWASERPGDLVGPLRGLGQQIVEARNAQGGFDSKLDLLGIADPSDPNQVIQAEDLRFAWDFLTVYPPIEELTSEHFRTLQPALAPNSVFAVDQRAPVNVNTAPWPVLVALLQGLCGPAPGCTEVSQQDAIGLANEIVERRAVNVFDDWHELEGLLRLQTDPGGVFDGDPAAREKLAAIEANGDPHVRVKRLVPDAPVYQEVTKPELSFFTTELAFFSQGTFEITSLGQLFDPGGEVLNATQLYQTVRIFDITSFTSQRDFEGAAALYGDFDARTGPYASGSAGLHAFAYPNNTQRPYATRTERLDASSAFVGSILPLPLDLRSFDPGGVESDENLLFRADWNGGYSAHSQHQPDDPASGELFAQGSKPNGLLALPDDGSLGGDLLPDGVALRAGETASLFYPSRPAGAPPQQVGNFPPLLGSAPNDGAPNSGALLYWFKLDASWAQAGEFRTIFFANTAYEIPAPGLGLPDDRLKAGVQAEIQLAVSGPGGAAIDPARPLLRDAVLRVRRKFFATDENDQPVNPTPSFMPYVNVEFEKQIPFSAASGTGLHAHEWYHVALRWQDGTAIGGFGGPNPERAVGVCGLFHDAADQPSGPRTRLFDDDLGAAPQMQSYAPGLPASAFDAFSAPDPIRQARYKALSLVDQLHVGPAGTQPSPIVVIDDLRVSSTPEVNPFTDCARLPAPLPILTPEGPMDLYGAFQTTFAEPRLEPPTLLVVDLRPEPEGLGAPVIAERTAYFETYQPVDPASPSLPYERVYGVHFIAEREPGTEVVYQRFDVADVDSDDDGIPDLVEDADQDGEVDAGETDPNDADSDDDGIADGTEVGASAGEVGRGTDPGVFQPDEDPSTTTDPLAADSDADGLLDGEEDVNANGRVDAGETDPLDEDSDGDGLLDGEDPDPLDGIPIPALPAGLWLALGGLCALASWWLPRSGPRGGLRR